MLGFPTKIFSRDSKVFSELVFREEVPDSALRAALKDIYNITSLTDMMEYDDAVIFMGDESSDNYANVESFKGLEYFISAGRISIRMRDKQPNEFADLTALTQITRITQIRDINASFIGNFDRYSLCEEIYIRDCPNVDFSDLFTNFRMLTNLKKLYIRSVGASKAFPDNFFDIPSLTDELAIFYVPFGGQLPDKFDLLANKLNTIELVGCGFTNIVPPTLASQDEATRINLNRNAFSQSNPNTFNTQPMLSVFRLDNNELTSSEIENVTSDLVDSLNLTGRVACNVRLESNAEPANQQSQDHKTTLENAGWTVTL